MLELGGRKRIAPGRAVDPGQVERSRTDLVQSSKIRAASSCQRELKRIEQAHCKFDSVLLTRKFERFIG